MNVVTIIVGGVCPGMGRKTPKLFVCADERRAE